MAYNHRSYPFGPPNGYWKLNGYRDLSVNDMRDMLEKRGYDPGSIKDKDRLRESLQRADRGLLSYVKRSNDELRGLLSQRGIPNDFESGGRGSRAELIAKLECADYSRRFERFMNLPPELRTRVYDYYFAYFDKPLHTPVQPPLTLVCSQIRKEALPLFYATCTFDLNLHLRRQSYRNSPYLEKLKMRDDTLMWLHSVRPENLADIQHIRIGLSPEFQPTRDPEKTSLTMILQINKAQLYPQVLKSQCKLHQLSQSMRNTFQLVVAKEFLEADENGSADRKLTKEDFFTLRKAMETALKVIKP